MNPEVFLDGSTLAMLGGMVAFGVVMALASARSRWRARIVGRSGPRRPAPAPAWRAGRRVDALAGKRD